MLFAPAAAEGLRIEADEMQGDGATIFARGNVKAQTARGRLCADRLHYERQSGMVRAFGNVRAEGLAGDGAVVSGGSATYDTLARRGEMRDFRASLTNSPLRAEGEKLRFFGATVSADRMTLSSCPPEDRDWQIILRRALADREAETVSGHGARLEWEGVPVFWLPVGHWYYGKGKKTGFLTPQASYRSDGLDLAAPYYWFLRENMDATTTPRWAGEHGLLLSGEFRYLFARHRGDALAEAAPFESPSRSRQRWRHGWRGGKWRATVHAENVSDRDYFLDFSDSAEELGTRHLPRAARWEWESGGWRALLAAEDYKVLRRDRAPPHNILPRAQLGHDGWRDWGRWSADAELANFRANEAGAEEGARLFSLLRAERDFHFGSAAITPAAGLHISRYRLRGGGSPAFATPFARVDARRRFLWLNAPFGLSPLDANWRVGYVFAPKTRQSDAPLFDTELLQLNSARVFNWNRFVGGDRAADANFLAYGAEVRRRGKGGEEKLFAGLAQRFYFRAPRITLASEKSPPQRGFANLLLDFRARPAENLRLEGAAEWRAADDSLERLYADARAEFSGGRLMRAGVLLEEEESILWGASSPLGAGVSAGAFAKYFLDRDRFGEASAGLLIRDGCGCWALSLSATSLAESGGKNKVRYSIGLALGGLTDLGASGYDDIIGKLRD